MQTAEGPQRLELVDAHLEPLSSPKTLWVFKNPRAGQVRAILDLLDDRRASRDRRRSPASCSAAISIPCDPAPAKTPITSRARGRTAWRSEDRRNTHMMGRLDYLFFRLGDGWSASTRRLDERFGSDHYPVLGRSLSWGQAPKLAVSLVGSGRKAESQDLTLAIR